MKNLYLILSKAKALDEQSFELLNHSAESRGVKVQKIYIEDFDFSNPPQLGPDDALYRISTDFKSLLVEKILIQPHTKTFYKNYIWGVGKLNNTLEYTLIQQKNKLPIIPTIFSLSQEVKPLKKYAETLGGFPLIIKMPWHSHGEGILKINSLEELVETSKQLEKTDGCVMRKYIPHKRQGRLIVVGNKVVGSHENVPTTDFRSNVGENSERQRRAMTYSEEVQNIAAEAVNCLGYEFGGVDILFEEGSDKPHIAEVNMPCFFATTQRMTGVDISGLMVEHLMNKKPLL